MQKDDRSALDKASDNLDTVASLDERGRIALLVKTQDGLNNGDAMSYFGAWLDAVCDALDLDAPEEDPNENPFS